jgi:hypothetical protein
MGTRNVVDLDKVRERRQKQRENEAGAICRKCGSAGAFVWAHIVHCSEWSTEQKVRAMTGRYELDEAGARKTVERWERHKAEVIDLAAR